MKRAAVFVYLLLVFSLFLVRCTTQEAISEVIDQKFIEMEVVFSSPSGSEVLSETSTITLKVTPIPGQAIETVSGYVNTSDFSVGFSPSGNENEFTAQMDTTLLNNGENKLAISVNNARKAFSFFVDNQVILDEAPTVTLLNVSADQEIQGVYTLEAGAEAKNGKTITQVEFFAGDVSLGLATYTDGKYSLSWNTGAILQGSVLVKAIATDSSGKTGQNSVAVMINNDTEAPGVQLLSPSGNVNGTVTFKASAQAKGLRTISKVEFYVQNLLIGQGVFTNGYYEKTWNSQELADGNYPIKAVVTDDAGKTGEDGSKTIVIKNSPSSIAFTTPAGNSVSGIVVIEAAASSDIKKVKFYINNTEKYTATSIFKYSWNTSSMENGEYTLKIEGQDENNIVLATASKSVIVTNDDQEAPLVTLTAPQPSVSLEAGMPLLLSANATDNVGVVKVEFLAGNTVIATLEDAPYTAEWTAVAGNQDIKAIAYDARGNKGESTVVTVNVLNAEVPVVNITAPLNNSEVATGTLVEITFMATDNFSLDKVELYANNTLLTTITNGAQSYSWNPAAGSYSLKAIAYDKAGRVGEDNDTSITVVQGFVCANHAAAVYAHVNAGRAKGELNMTTYKYEYKAIGSGDNLGTDSMASITLREIRAGYYEKGECQSIDNIAPSVAITSPGSGATLSGKVSVAAAASDNVGVSKVEFFANTTLLAEKTAAPYSLEWNTAGVSNGNYTLKAKASDAAGNQSEVSISVNVDNGIDTVSPTVNITSPANSASVSGIVSITVNAQDNAGVSRVEFFANNSPIGISTVAPFSLSWDTTTLTPGSYSLKAIAYDGAGNSGTDADTTVNIEAGGEEYDPTNGLVKISGSYTGLNNVYKYIPAGMKSNVAYPLIVVAHGCLETAQEHSNNSQWTKLADKYKFFLVYPEETSQVGKCLDWWTATSQNGGGDTGSTIQAVKDLMGAKSLCSINGSATKCKVDAGKVFVNGFSAGGGLAIQLLAVEPTLFKKGAIHAGVPYKGYTGPDTNSLGYINGGKNLSPAEWAAKMPQNPGTYPPIIVFHGEGDTTVNYTFMNEIMEQWTEVHRIDRTPDNNGSKLKPDNNGHTYNEYRDNNGNLVVATVSITGKGTMKMTHRVAVDPNGTGVDAGGSSAGTYAEDAGLYSAYYALKFFGIVQ